MQKIAWEISWGSLSCELYKMAIPAKSIARAIAYAIEQPAEVEIDEVVVGPTAQDF